MTRWCPCCREYVETWSDSYVEDGHLHTTVMCGMCNAVLLKYAEAVKK